jgi:hypothetical protein
MYLQNLKHSSTSPVFKNLGKFENETPFSLNENNKTSNHHSITPEYSIEEIVAVTEGANGSENVNDNTENGDERGNEAEASTNNKERICSVSELQFRGSGRRSGGGFFDFLSPIHLKPISR